jgi:hypothetical protein
MLRAVVLLLVPAHVGAQAPPSRPAPAPAHEAALAEEPDDAPDPMEHARLLVWLAYCSSMSEGLQQSSVARDWAIAALVPRFRVGTHEADCGGNGKSLLERAARTAPDDVVVQWIAAHASGIDATLANDAMHRLQKIEPDNALVWFGDLADAARRNDTDGIDTAMRHIGSASRYDEHFTEILRAVLGTFERYPVPDAYWSIADDEEKRYGREGIAFSAALMAGSAVSPSLQQVVAACRVDRQTGRNMPHAPDCASVARLMARQGDTVLANRIGYTILRLSQTYTQADESAARSDDWAYSHAQQLMNSDKTDTAAREMLAYENDWLTTRSELEAMRRKLVRRGLPAQPPPEWIDTDSPFSAKRLQQDAQRTPTKQGD